jgi:Chloroplast envelope transporter
MDYSSSSRRRRTVSSSSTRRQCRLDAPVATGAAAAVVTAVALGALVLATAPASTAAFHTAFVPKHYGRSSFVQPPNSRLRPLAATVVAPPNGGGASSLSSAVVASKSSAASATTPMSMLVETSGGMEELQELMEKMDSTSVLSKQVRSRPSLWKLAGYASIPVGAALGFGLVPSRRLAAHALGAVVTGIAGAVGKSKIDNIAEASAKPALASAIVDLGLDDPEETHQAVLRVQEQFGILDEDFEILTVEIYATYLAGMVKYNPAAKTSELKELEGLRTALGLSNLQVGEAHALAAAEWYRTTCLFTPEEELEDPDHPDRQAMDKLLFLTERALQGETPEAFKFEMTRVAKALNLDATTAMERVADVMEPFYQRALASTRSKLGTNQVSSGMLQRARQTLGVSEATAKDMHIACFNQEVRALLGLPDASSSSSSTGSDGDSDAAAPVDLTAVKFSEGASERVRFQHGNDKK